MLKNLFLNYEEAVAVILFVAGFSMLLFRRNLILKLIGRYSGKEKTLA